jgi:hypothetical protein
LKPLEERPFSIYTNAIRGQPKTSRSVAAPLKTGAKVEKINGTRKDSAKNPLAKNSERQNKQEQISKRNGEFVLHNFSSRCSKWLIL